jgi:hypothetical protein
VCVCVSVTFGGLSYLIAFTYSSATNSEAHLHTLHTRIGRRRDRHPITRSRQLRCASTARVARSFLLRACIASPHPQTGHTVTPQQTRQDTRSFARRLPLISLTYTRSRARPALPQDASTLHHQRQAASRTRCTCIVATSSAR